MPLPWGTGWVTARVAQAAGSAGLTALRAGAGLTRLGQPACLLETQGSRLPVTPMQVSTGVRGISVPQDRVT